MNRSGIRFSEDQEAVVYADAVRSPSEEPCFTGYGQQFFSVGDCFPPTLTSRVQMNLNSTLGGAYIGQLPSVISPEHTSSVARIQTSNIYDQRPVSPPPKRARINYTKYQEDLLNCIIAKIRYPNTMQKQVIAKRVGITRHQVKVWFQNRRRKDVIAAQKPQSGSDSPGSSSDDAGKDSPCVVPAEVVANVLHEMNCYDGDEFKSSKTARKKIADHRHSPYATQSPRAQLNQQQQTILPLRREYVNEVSQLTNELSSTPLPTSAQIGGHYGHAPSWRIPVDAYVNTSQPSYSMNGGFNMYRSQNATESQVWNELDYCDVDLLRGVPAFGQLYSTADGTRSYHPARSHGTTNYYGGAIAGQ